MAKIANPRDIIIAPVVSEKSYGLMEQNVYTFLVDPASNKTQIKIAVEQIFGVKVPVNTLNREVSVSAPAPVSGSARPLARHVTLRRQRPIDIFGRLRA